MNKKPLLILLALTIFMIGYWIPEDRHVPVANAKPYAGSSTAYGYKVGGVNAQKGITIFADQGAAVEAVTSGLVLYSEQTPQGDYSVWVLGAKWRLHHYANLDTVEVTPASWVKTSEKIGTIGTAKPAKPTKAASANLYYSIRSLPPLVTEWKAEQPLGLDQVFYVNPHEFLTAYQNETKAAH
ncbi:MAG: peptidase M23 [Thiothrix lacustris]|uniref:Peptidase M23 n=1 Tax=Thiothrix lacustris TaxID=525917 RepID=A0A1Y1QWI7_9GAMM|nr:MAG: peptidase M23 [Thiothrix lacustris]